MKFVEIIPLTGGLGSLTYSVPSELEAKVKIGSLVSINLQSRTLAGIVISNSFDSGKFKIRPINKILQENLALVPSLINLAKWISQYYACHISKVVETMIASSVRKGMQSLLLNGVALGINLDEQEEEKLKKRSPRAFDIYEFLKNNKGAFTNSYLQSKLNVSVQSINGLIKKGILKEESLQKVRDAYKDDYGQVEKKMVQKVILNNEQKEALCDIENSINENKFCVHLLYGVTASGKTEVYLEAMKKVLQAGKKVIFLVPEVTLTPQTVGRLRARLESIGADIVVWHSLLSGGQRYDSWKAISSGKANVVVGARSAIFSPMENVGLIIVDEEHDSAYKQDQSPRYNGRDISVVRAKMENCVCILGSATPSLESIYNCKIGKYKLNEIKKRIDDAILPKMFICNMNNETYKSQKSTSPISQILAQKLFDRFEKKEQVILFLNRRGYSRTLVCPDCEETLYCPNCSYPLTLHSDKSARCHLCDYFQEAPKECPSCGSDKILWKGFGTQKVEEYIKKILPDAKIARIDADTMKKKDAFRQILSDFRMGKINILLGTQMIAKGLDFPNVTLVGILNADTGLYMPDFRASERTFQLLVQVSGRAGRGGKKGEVIVQTYSPTAPSILSAKNETFNSFIENELSLRKSYNYPPYTRIIRHIFLSQNEQKANFYAESFGKILRQNFKANILDIKGPATAPLEKLDKHYRKHLVYFTKNIYAIMPKIMELRKSFKMENDVSDYFDCDPNDQM